MMNANSYFGTARYLLIMYIVLLELGFYQIAMGSCNRAVQADSGLL